MNTNNYVTADGMINHNSGKSVTCVWDIFIKMGQQVPDLDGKRRTRWIIARNTYSELENTTMATWKDWFPESVFGNISRKPPYKQVFKYNDIEAEIIFLALEKPEDQKKLLSFEVTGIWFNEARETQWELIIAALGRTGRYPSKKDKPPHVPNDKWPTWSGLLFDTNPPDDSHWYYDMAENDLWAIDRDENKVEIETIPEEKRWQFFSQPSGMSPEAENIEHLPNGYDYYEKLLIGGNSKEWIDVHVHGKYGFIKKGMPVYEGYWNHDLMVSERPLVKNPAGTIYLGIDSSGRHPATLMAQKNSHGQWQILDEYCITSDAGLGAELYSKQLAQMLNEKFPNHSFEIWGDPAGEWGQQNDERTYFDILKANGIPIRAAQNALRIPDRLETVKSVLSRLVNGKPAMIIDPRCKMLIRGFNGGYKYKRISSGGDTRYDEKPDKTNRFADVHDALQYLLCGSGEGRKLKRGKSKFRGTYQATVAIPTI